MNEIPCIANLDFNCPNNCKLRFMAVAKINDLANNEGVSVEIAIRALRRMRQGQKIVHNTNNSQILMEHNRFDECSNNKKAPPAPGRDQ